MALTMKATRLSASIDDADPADVGTELRPSFRAISQALTQLQLEKETPRYQ